MNIIILSLIKLEIIEVRKQIILKLLYVSHYHRMPGAWYHLECQGRELEMNNTANKHPLPPSRKHGRNFQILSVLLKWRCTSLLTNLNSLAPFLCILVWMTAGGYASTRGTWDLLKDEYLRSQAGQLLGHSKPLLAS